MDYNFDVCIAGAGLSGAVLAERHASLGDRVVVFEKRDHIGGNVFDYIDEETGIRVSKYGVHLFHTNSDKVWEYVRPFTSWTPWEHRVQAKVKDKFVPVPVNINTVNILFDANVRSPKDMTHWLQNEVEHIKSPRNSEEMALTRVGRRLYDLIFKPYTIKQWDKQPRQLNSSVTGRIPVRTDYEDRYFTDKHQYLPAHGYTAWVSSMFKNHNIQVGLNTDYFTERNRVWCGMTYFTGPIDAYFAQSGLPKLEYRSLSFERRVYKDREFFQPAAHVNYPGMEYNFTRAIEYKHLWNQQNPSTVVFFERSSDDGEPYYPVPNKRNQALFERYKKMADDAENVVFVGRLANYKYFNMDETVLNALELFEKENAWRLSNTPTATGRAPRCALLSYVHNEKGTLDVWMRYYLRHFAKEDVYILDHETTDGSTAHLPVFVHKLRAPTVWMPHQFLNTVVASWQKHLLYQYQCVVLAETDEFLIPDPKLFPGGLKDYLAEFVTSEKLHVRAEGYEVVHKEGERALDYTAPILAQRTTWIQSGMYSKPYITKVPLKYVPGFHSNIGQKVNIDRRIRLAHMHFADFNHCVERLSRSIIDKHKRKMIAKEEQNHWNELSYKHIDPYKNCAKHNLTKGLPIETWATIVI